MTKNISFEKSLAELEKIVAQLENGGLSLDNSLKYFEKGITLTQQCEEILKDAEQKVEILLNKNISKNE